MSKHLPKADASGWLKWAQRGLISDRRAAFATGQHATTGEPRAKSLLPSTSEIRAGRSGLVAQSPLRINRAMATFIRTFYARNQVVHFGFRRNRSRPISERSEPSTLVILMPRRLTDCREISRIDALRGSGRTVEDACRRVGVPPSTYYRLKSRSVTPAFSAVQRDWRKLRESYKPRLKGLSRQKRLILVHDVANAFLSTFGRNSWVRTGKQIADELERFRRAAGSAVTSFDRLSPDSATWLDGLLEQQIKSKGRPVQAIAVLREYAELVERLTADIRSAKRINNRGQGGPISDPKDAPAYRTTRSHLQAICSPPPHPFIQGR